MIDGIDSSIRDQLAAELNGVSVAAPSWADVVRRSGKAPRSRRRGLMARWWRRPLAVGVAAALLVACPIAIAVVATQHWWFDGAGPRRDSPIVVVFSTSWSGQPWTLSAYANNKQGICLAISGPKNAGALGCDRINGVPRPAGSSAFTPHDISFLQAVGPRGPNWIAGQVAARITGVAALLSDGSILRAKTAPAPPMLHASVRFYLIRAPRGLTVVRNGPSLPQSGLIVRRIAGYADGKLTACVDLEHFRLRAPLASCRF